MRTGKNPDATAPSTSKPDSHRSLVCVCYANNTIVSALKRKVFRVACVCEMRARIEI